ncbi:MAG: 4-hydroxy-3-methylbut-2-enyl diphosphate reductase [Firmicutes bacterium]|nr:4-hydroxy-3-methylbut-2-enyl diphosphate reductase [Bacillota bacterium]
MRNAEKRILLASPRGFCVGVERGVRILADAVNREKGTVYVLGEIVHNTVLLNRFKSLGAVFAEEIGEIPSGSAVIFPTHGVAPAVREKALAKNLKIIDAACPFVQQVHEEARRLKKQGYAIVLIGDPDHPEVIGVAGEAPDNIRVVRGEADLGRLCGIDGSRVSWLSQTTLDFEATQRTAELLREKYPSLRDPPRAGVCRAVSDRQKAVRNIAGECDLFIAVGSANSSNTNRLAEAALEAGAAKAIRADTPEELDGVDFSAVNTVGVSSGTSVSDAQLAGVISYLKKNGYDRIEERSILDNCRN